MGTENGITIYSPKDHFFRNWTREQGLMSVNFNAVLPQLTVTVRLSLVAMMVLLSFRQT